ncbi:MAG: sodium/proton antiporter NhaB [Nitrospinae bacterium]|nr:sodium/proton antiporter NhaB [Nitrospinota bacterium]MBF0633523.1 sodium/proton antiporter NhaB [Nitrospinota bacterium]
MLENYFRNFMGASPAWYKIAIAFFLAVNPLIYALCGGFIAGWILVAEFIFTLAMALKCHPLQPGGLLAMEAVVIGMATPEMVYKEAHANFPVIMLLMFMVAAIHFMQEFLILIFTRIFIAVRSKKTLSLVFLVVSAFLSAFLDALTVMAVLITVSHGFYGVYHQYQSVHGENDEELASLRWFLRDLLMHGAVGTALGGVMTLVGEPQNLIIASIMGWSFVEFFLKMIPVTGPVFIIGAFICFMVEQFKMFGYGGTLPENARHVISTHARQAAVTMDGRMKARIYTQAACGLVLIFALAFHVAEVGVIGLGLIIVLTALNGITDERAIGKAFHEALPFTALIVVFFAVVAVIHEQHLFAPVIEWTMRMEGSARRVAFFGASGILSAISDNVFVATIYIAEAKKAFDTGLLSRAEYDLIAIAINTGTNIPSVATPNGQAAFLFLLTSSIAALIRLSYMKMIVMAAPYTVGMTVTALLAVVFLL